jgi:hypothetical protein
MPRRSLHANPLPSGIADHDSSHIVKDIVAHRQLTRKIFATHHATWESIADTTSMLHNKADLALREASPETRAVLKLTLGQITRREIENIT